MPALVKSRVGSSWGTQGLLGTIVCARGAALKYSRKVERIWADVIEGEGIEGEGRCGGGKREKLEAETSAPFPCG
jgi:hypothetical protein